MRARFTFNDRRTTPIIRPNNGDNGLTGRIQRRRNIGGASATFYFLPPGMIDVGPPPCPAPED
jgi:hypothetical protein